MIDKMTHLMLWYHSYLTYLDLLSLHFRLNFRMGHTHKISVGEKPH